MRHAGVESNEKKQEKRKKKQTVAKQAPYGRDAPEALVKRRRIAGRARSPLNASFYRYVERGCAKSTALEPSPARACLSARARRRNHRPSSQRTSWSEPATVGSLL